MDGWMDGWDGRLTCDFRPFFNNIPVISGRRSDDTEICVQWNFVFSVEKILPRLGIELGPLDQ